MTKEEVLAKNIGTENIQDLQLELILNPELHYVLKSMDEYAKQEAIEFVAFCNASYWRSPLIQGGLWYDYYTLDKIGVIPDTSKGLTTEQLYELFLKQKQ